MREKQVYALILERERESERELLHTSVPLFIQNQHFRPLYICCQFILNDIDLWSNKLKDATSELHTSLGFLCWMNEKCDRIR